MIRKLKGRVVIVTGAARGIGKAIAEKFFQGGATLMLADVDPDPLSKVQAKLSGRDTAVLTLLTDVSKTRDVQRLVRKTLNSFERVDVLINNAGIYRITPFQEISNGEWNLVLNTNLKGTFLCSKFVAKAMIKQREGKIINIASTAAKTGGIIGGVHYAASKAGVICLTKYLARILAPYNINVNAICPGLIATRMSKSYITERVKAVPLGRAGQPKDVANAALFLASPDSSFITGEILDVNGGTIMD